MKHTLNSFKYALRGIMYAVCEESHMRFHITAAFYVLVFAGFYNLSVSQWAVLLLLIASVLAAETFNTALEELCDLETDGYDPLARVAKDAAAGGVLIISICAVVIGVLFFGDIGTLFRIATFFLERPPLAVLLIFSLVFSALFVIFGPRRLFHGKRGKNG